MERDLVMEPDMPTGKEPPALALSPTTVFGGVMLMLNLAALVWGAATINATVSHTTEALKDVTAAMESVRGTLNRMDTRVSVLEDREQRRPAQ